MPEKKLSPYGSWKSPITSDLIVSGTIALGEIALSEGDVYWIESRPSEAGRSVIVRRTPDGEITDVTPPPFNARTRVHEYGGGSYLVTSDAIYFSNFADNRIYRQAKDAQPQALTPESKMRYADGAMDARRNRLIYVREDHTEAGRDSVNTIVGVDAESGANTVLVEGADFYSSPRLSGDGRFLAYLAWHHPNLPWDGTELWLAELRDDGSIASAKVVAGGTSESIFQPEWSPDGVLHFVSDRTGWWNLYRLVEDNAQALCEMQAEFGAPQWVFNMSFYAFASAAEIICAYSEQGNWKLARLDTGAKKLTPIATPYTDIRNVRVAKNQAVFGAGSPTEMDAIVSLNLETEELTVLRRSSELPIDEAYLSIAEAIEFPTENQLTAHAFYYAPKSKDYRAPEDEKPPLIVISHGGPTGATSSTLSLRIQYWTTRGIGVVDVNYGGSTGYGRAYRERLNGNWGVVDVDDCVNAAQYLVEQGKADGQRLIIRGGSAGGYTTLAALTFRDVFKAGASYYGISDLEALEQDCHKFESRYNTSLIAAYPAAKELYKARSPIHHTQQLSCPIILFQGSDDKVVPANQSEMMLAAMREKGLPVAYVLFAGEGHGFRKAENIKRSLDAELYFYSRVFGFPVEAQVDEDLLQGFYNFPSS
jgi:dipeptidyl aminopeptidase/acylaminoacyl peptidase